MPYYDNQENWNSDDWWAFHRYLHRMFWTKRMDEIKNIDEKRLSEKTKVLMFCILTYYSMQDILDLENMKWCRNCKPLTEALILNEEHPVSTGNDIYKIMNVIC